MRAKLLTVILTVRVPDGHFPAQYILYGREGYYGEMFAGTQMYGSSIEQKTPILPSLFMFDYKSTVSLETRVEVDRSCFPCGLRLAPSPLVAIGSFTVSL